MNDNIIIQYFFFIPVRFKDVDTVEFEVNRSFQVEMHYDLPMDTETRELIGIWI